MPPSHPPVLQGANPVPAPALPLNNVDPTARISGVLQVAKQVESKVPKGAAIFLMVRTAAGGAAVPGPPVAAKKLTVASWPLPFEVTSDDVMLEGSKLSGQVIISARVDQDGDAMTKEAGDVEGQSKVIAVPQTKVEVVLDTVRTTTSGTPLNLGGSPGTGGSGGSLPPGHP